MLAFIIGCVRVLSLIAAFSVSMSIFKDKYASVLGKIIGMSGAWLAILSGTDAALFVWREMMNAAMPDTIPALHSIYLQGNIASGVFAVGLLSYYVAIHTFVFTEPDKKEQRLAQAQEQQAAKEGEVAFERRGNLINIRQVVGRNGYVILTEIETTSCILTVDGEIGNDVQKGKPVFVNKRNQVKVGETEGKTYSLRS